MQALSIAREILPYDNGMKTGRPPKSSSNDFGDRLRVLREASGLSQRAIAAQLGIAQPSYVMWEKRNVSLRPEQLTKLSGILGVRPEQLLSDDAAPARQSAPAGKVRRLFDSVSKLPRSQQEKVIAILEPFVARHGEPTT
jgi:transcriptional regulator with XRE-family HTH domain